MADNRYGGGRFEGRREREDSIFSDHGDRSGRDSGRWSGERGRARELGWGSGGGGDDRGLFERAGDEVRSWFGDDDAERRRERDSRRDEARSAFGGAGGWGERDSRREYDRPAFGGGPAPRSRWDDNYLRWRDRQIARFDREYEEYCRECQQQFDQDFGSWRSSRLTEGGSTGRFGTAGADTGSGASGAPGTAAETTGETAGTGGDAPSSAGGRGRARNA